VFGVFGYVLPTLKEERARLFDNVVQFNASKLQAGQGSGIGLWSKLIIIIIIMILMTRVTGLIRNSDVNFKNIECQLA
jgi:hypothetical protein